MDRVDVRAFHGRQVNHHAAIAYSEAGKAMAAGAHRGQQSVPACEFNCANHVRLIRTSDYKSRPSIDSIIPDAACFSIVAIAREDDVSS